MSATAWLMSNCWCFSVCALFLPSMVEAATVIKPIVACKSKDDTKKVIDFLGKKDNTGLDKFSGPKLAKGDCFGLSKGEEVTIDTKDGQLRIRDAVPPDLGGNGLALYEIGGNTMRCSVRDQSG